MRPNSGLYNQRKMMAVAAAGTTTGRKYAARNAPMPRKPVLTASASNRPNAIPTGMVISA
jgi:hypothetical protein